MLTLSFMKIVWLKKLDVLYQILGFILMVYCWMDEHLGWFMFSMYLMAIVQVISCICWAIIDINKPINRRRSVLQRCFAIVSILIMLMTFASFDTFTNFSIIIMSWLGPVLGISYFITTIKEISFYRSLVHRDAI